ncbi:growth hormone secretagogue receptor type 1 isoform X3 [Paramuricea clavata]|uniref:Growth hormone secretagogue receptor type 1 isoform X3 n=1 Tax=Paramuricea clavata TaxID=317549 RepID=A0A7D9E0D2_PARCT|nr:growth hormone secretagogue receptor type 1 isoform X3 [Paramuricea clavata]
MGKTAYDAWRYSYASVLAFGTLGNILVIISILRQKRVLKNNYYFLVLHLAISDLGALIIFLCDVKKGIVKVSTWYCGFSATSYLFEVAGIGMMLVISVLRYRATVHPLKPAISRRKLKVVCGLVYLCGLIAGYGAYVPECFLLNDPYWKFRNACSIFFFNVPTIFMAVAYYKISRALIKQNRYMKSIYSNPVTRSAPGSSFNILRFVQNRRTFLVCLITILCFGVGNIPMSVNLLFILAEEHHQDMKKFWIYYLASVLRVAGTHSVNPLIYGVLDKKLLTFWKLCRKKKPRTQEN